MMDNGCFAAFIRSSHTHTTVSNFFSAEVDLKTREEIRWQGQNRLGNFFLMLRKPFQPEIRFFLLKYYHRN